MRFQYHIITTMIFSALASHSMANQTVIEGYDSARDIFWMKVHVSSAGQSLYCDITYDENGKYIDQKTKKLKKMSLEHAYAADWIATHFQCDDRNTCDVKEYHYAEADLHNLWPAIQNVNSSRGDSLFGELPDDQSDNRFIGRGCADFERNYGVPDHLVRVEPRDQSKGEIARSILYMHDAYGLPLLGMSAMLLEWHKSDPVTEIEKIRNKIIYNEQHTYNHWIERLKGKD